MPMSGSARLLPGSVPLLRVQPPSLSLAAFWETVPFPGSVPFPRSVPFLGVCPTSLGLSYF
jgi:hypothetical protein